MNQEQALRLIRQTFEARYDETRFKTFIRNLLGQWQEDPRPAQSGSALPEAFREFVIQYRRLGEFTDVNGQQVDVLTIRLKGGTTLERARTAQRNFVARHLEQHGKDAAIVAFSSEGVDEWRFSLIKLEVNYISDEEGKLKFQKNLTPAKRLSFLVGPGEGSHTAQRRLYPLLQEEQAPTLASLEATFNIEVVTDEFFEDYKRLFLTLKGDLDTLVEKRQDIRDEFGDKHIDTATFAKRLMGQLVFLYFVQKKGWLGVAKQERWGDGPRDFIRRMYEGKVTAYDNFFDDLLEPLFYEGLALDRRYDEHYFSHLNCRIPFLNGGLFEPMNGYDWVNLSIPLPNAHLGAVLDTFDLYNFTVQEDSPLDKEVAVDPEMLGKVFENLLEITDRKSKGAFYTPREIVHYMAQDALIHYLDRGLNFQTAELVTGTPQGLFGHQTPLQRQPTLAARTYAVSVPVADLTAFIRYADLAQEHDATTATKAQETDAYTFKVPASIRTHAGQIDDLLAHVKVIDPAIGSGAFPVGMLTEIVRGRSSLTPFLRTDEDRSLYTLKRHAIFESIYGVDIDAAAVDIAKLRLWLALVVDEDDFSTIKPLPNLDYKIVVGNSMSRIEGFTDFDAKGQIAELKERYFNESNTSKKRGYRTQINEATQKVYAAARHWGQDGTFDFHVAFGEVFKDQGFDIAIGNPPYVRQEAIKHLKPALKKAFPDVYNGTADLYTYFYAAALEVLKPGGILAYITPNKWFKANYGKSLRRHLADRMAIHNIIDFGELPVFKNATTYPMIFVAEKRDGRAVETVLTEVKSLAAPYPDVELLVQEQGQVLPEGAIKGEDWKLMSNDMADRVAQMRAKGVPLGEYVDNKIYWGIKTGLNEAFVINSEKRAELVAADPRSAEIIKPLAVGDDVRRWHVRDKQRYLIFTRRGTKIDDYPAVKQYLEKFRKKLEPKPKDWDESESWSGRKLGTYKWYEIQDEVAYYKEFDKPKIIYPDITQRSRFSIDVSGRYSNDTTFIIPLQDYYLLGILNSKVVWEYLNMVSASIQGKSLRMKKIYISTIPIPDPNNVFYSRIAELSKVLNGSLTPLEEDEAELNSLVEKLYFQSP